MLTIVIPAFNEEDSIGPSLDRLHDALSESPIGEYELLVVDDGSTDKTFSVASSKDARVVRNPHNVGYGRALKTGIHAASFDTICIIDADLTYPVDAIPTLYSAYQEGFDMVIGARQGAHYSGSGIKGPLRWVLRQLVEFAASKEVPDANSGLRIFNRTTILPHLDHLSDVFSFTTSLTLAYTMSGLFVKHIPIAYNERVGETKVRLLKDSIRTLLFICRAIMYYNPLKIFLLFSLACGVGGILGFVVGAVTGFAAPYYVSIGLVLMTLLMFGIGLIAELLRQILIRSSHPRQDTARHRP